MKPDNPFPDIFESLFGGKPPPVPVKDIRTKEQREARERDAKLQDALRHVKEALAK